MGRAKLYSALCLYDVDSVKRYEGVFTIVRTGAVKIIKSTLRPIGRHHPRSSSLPRLDTGPTVSSNFGTLPGNPFLSECQALFAIRPESSQWYQTGAISA
jgi:hypothetical protein